jgi:O-methyltransferase involved in polyketide biosynthesis
MARTADDSWDITEGVGATALGVAWARAEEMTSECPLFSDPYAQLFVDAAIERGWRLPPEYMLERIRAISGYAASRTKWFDEFGRSRALCTTTVRWRPPGRDKMREINDYSRRECDC